MPLNLIASKILKFNGSSNHEYLGTKSLLAYVHTLLVEDIVGFSAFGGEYFVITISSRYEISKLDYDAGLLMWINRIKESNESIPY